jgi:hypothetical protein
LPDLFEDALLAFLDTEAWDEAELFNVKSVSGEALQGAYQESFQEFDDRREY